MAKVVNNKDKDIVMTVKVGIDMEFCFGVALEYLKIGYRVARKGWNGKGMFVFIDPGHTCNGYETFTGKMQNIVNPFFFIKNVDETLSTWVPSVNDCLAEDWVIYEKV